MSQIWLKGNDNYLSGLLMKAADDNSQIVILLSGFMQAKSDSYYFMSDFAKYLLKNGFDVLMVDLMGSGDSFGCIEEIELEKIKSDVFRIIQYVNAEGYKKVFAVGRGLSANLFAQIKNDSYVMSKIACVNPVLIDSNMSEKIMNCLNKNNDNGIIKISNEVLRDLNELFEMMGTEKSNILGECLKLSFLMDLVENLTCASFVTDKANIIIFCTCDYDNIYSRYYSVLPYGCNCQLNFSKYNDRISIMNEIVQNFKKCEVDASESTL